MMSIIITLYPYISYNNYVIYVISDKMGVQFTNLMDDVKRETIS